MAITVKDINEKIFTKQVRGYSIEEVDDFLDELAAQMETIIRENCALMQQLEEAKAAAVKEPVVVIKEAEASAPVVESEPVQVAAPVQQPMLADEPQYFKNLETTLRETLLNAQRIADETVAEARKKANSMVANAEEQAAAITSAAKVEAESVRAEADETRKAAADYRARFLRLIEDQVHVLKADGSLFE
ncbi:MAG: DivIVA domain-containing protein [Clostridia bacterium]|nr:DivIVA domain-containing protein [Clostridia bacterium]